MLRKENKIKYFHQLKTKITLSFLFVSIFICSVLFGLVYFQSYNLVLEDLQRNSLNIAKATSERIDSKTLQELNTEEDMDHPYYTQLGETLNDIRKISGAKFLYVMTLNDQGEYIYIIESSDYNSANATLIGEVEENYYASFSDVMAGNAVSENEISDDEYGKLLSSYSPIQDGDHVIGFVGVDYDVESDYQAFHEFRIEMLLLTMILFILVSLVGLFISNKIAKPIMLLSKEATKLASYDLTIEGLTFNSNSEIGVLANSFNEMVRNLKILINSIVQTSVKINETSNSISAASEEVTASSEEISSMIHEISIGAVNQANEANTTLTTTSNLSEKIEEITHNLKLSVDDAMEMKSMNELGLQTIDELDQSIKKDTDVRVLVRERIEELSDKSKSIGAIVDTINSIAEQTNLLALNAAIEAARAGEHGRGFAVVAEEVRKLAEQSSKATMEITHTLESIIQVVGETSQSMHDSKVMADSASSHLETTKATFKEIKIVSDELVKKIEGLGNQIAYVDQTKLDVVTSITNISTITQQSASATQEISSSAEEQTGCTENIAESIQELNTMIKKLHETVELFKI